MIQRYTVDGRSFSIAYPENFAPPEFTEDQLRELLRRATRHSSITALRDALWDERNKELKGILAITGPNVDNIRFHDPNAYMVAADEEVEWDLDLAFQLVPGLKAVKSDIAWWEMSCSVSFTAKTIKEYDGKMGRLRQFLRSINGAVEKDSLRFFRRASDSVIASFCKAVNRPFPWEARRVTNKSIRWYEKLPGIRIRLRKKQRNAPGQ